MRWWLLPVIAGCIMPGFGHCGPLVDLTWHEPGLYEHLAYGDVSAQWNAAQGALPWPDEPWPGARLARVGMEVPAPDFHTRGIVSYSAPHVMGISLVRGGVVELATDGDVPEADVRVAWVRFVSNVTDATPAAFEAGWPTFWASRLPAGSSSGIPLNDENTEWEDRPHWVYHGRPPGDLVLKELASRIALPEPTHAAVGTASAGAGAWEFAFALPVWDIGAPEGMLQVDSKDRAWFVSADPAGSEDEARQRAASLLERVSWVPVFEDVEPIVMVC